MADPDSVLDPSQLFIIKLEAGGVELRWPTPSPDWIVWESSTLDPGDWADRPPPLSTDRQSGEWIVTVPGPLADRQFYRLQKPDTASAAVFSRKGRKPSTK
jgi:hypothetical protein